MEFTDEQKAEIDLIRLIGEGDRASFALLYDRFSTLLFSVAWKILNNREAAEDVLQDVFVTIWQKAAAYDSTRGKPITWAVTITRNLSIDRLRALQRRYRLNDEVEREAQLTAPVESVVDNTSVLERGQIVRSVVTLLTVDQRQAIELAFFGGMTQSEIATEINEPIGTVKARIRRGMLKMRELLSGKL